MNEETNFDVNSDDEMTFPDDYFIYDKEDAKSVIQGLPNQIKQAYKLGDNIQFDGPVEKVIITGMGGSAIAGDLLKLYLRDYPIDISVNRNYDLPKSADKNTLVIVSSYSGNTEETISAFKDAIRKNCKIVCITSGGKVSEMCITNRIQVIKIPRGIQPRAALGYSMFPMLKVLQNLKLVSNKQKEVDNLVSSLDKKVFMETGMKLSEKLVNKIPIIYSSNLFGAVSFRWKTQINENAKTLALQNVFSELNHNELAAIENLQAKFHCVIIRTDLDHHRMVKRMDITKEHLKKQGIDVTEIAIKGDNLLTKIFSAVYIGDWTSYFLALRYKTDPSPVKEIESFKKELGAFIS